MSNPGDLLIGSIGTSNYDEIVYELDGEKAKADISPAALTKLCNIGQALIFRTPEAGEKNDHRLREAFSATNIDFELIDIGLIEEQEDVNKILQRIVDTTRSSRFREDSIILDISHSFRSIPIVFLLSVMQLTSIYENAALKKIYYSRFAGSSNHESSPVIDMTYLRTMIEWYDAFEMADQNGTYREIRVLLEKRRDEIFRYNESHPERQEFSKAVGQFKAAQQAIDAGFPLEAGVNANVALDSISGLDEEAFVGPEGTVLNSLRRLLNGFDTDQDVSNKSELTLDEKELRRQANIVQYYVDNERYWIAIECARELMINRFLYDAGLTDDWLKHDNRGRIAPAPGDKHDQFTHDVDAVQALWDQIRKARNQYAHAGFKTDGREDVDDINQWIEKLCNRIDDDEFWNDK